MSIWSMWKENAGTLVILILVSGALMTINVNAWIIIGILSLVGGIWMNWQRGRAMGHEACSVRDTVERASDPASGMHGQLDEKYMARAYSVPKALKGVAVCAAIPFACGVIYILCMLFFRNEAAQLVTRILAWVLALPFWPLVAHWFETYDSLAPALVAVFLISPFVLPLAYFAGYLQGPKLWAHTEQAMKEGRRRAKAKSRVVRKPVRKPRGPEI